jgi:predicted Rossmann fold nucleotide-binding protein DprA/Smf involved in DNA uptake
VDIKATVARLTVERDKLDKAIQALRALEDSSDPARRAASPRPARRRRAPRRTATSNGASASSSTALTPENVVRLLTTGGVPASKVREQTGGSADAVLRVLKQLESDGAVKRSGARRSTKWHLAGK